MAAKHDIQLSAITTICLSLESILKKCFGPNGLSVMLTTATGTLMITGSGAAILRSLHLSHPIGRMVTDSVVTHCQHTGDNCKTFVFLLCGMLRKLRDLTANGQPCQCERQTVACALAHLKHAVLHSLVSQSISEQSTTVCCTQENLHRVKTTCNDMFASTLRGRFNKATASHLAKVLVEMTFADVDVDDIPLAIDECIKYFPQVHVEIAGNAILSTHVLDGIIIQRDIKVYIPLVMENGVRFMLVAFDVTDTQASGCDDIAATIHVTSTDQLRDTFAWKMSHVQGFVQLITSRGVNLLVCSNVVSDVLAFHCRRAGISIIQAVDEDDVKRLEFVFNIHAVYCWSELLSTRVIGHARSCKSVQLGVHRWAVLRPDPATTRPCSRSLSQQLIVCAPTAGLCDQVSSALLGCLKCSRMLFDTSVLCDASGSNPWPMPCTQTSEESQTGLDASTGICHSHCVFIPGGGTFERTLYKALQSYKQRCNDTSLTRGAELLQHGLRSVLTHLAQNSFASSDMRPLVVVAMATSGKQLDGVIEPLASKMVLLYDLVSLLQQLLRVDMLVPVRRLCPTNDAQSQLR